MYVFHFYLNKPQKSALVLLFARFIHKKTPAQIIATDVFKQTN